MAWPGSAAAAQAVTVTFGFTGAAPTFTVPAGVDAVTVEAYGAFGGGCRGTAAALVGLSRATLTVTGGEVLQVNIGGAGTGCGFARQGFGWGGWNGGGGGGPSGNFRAAGGGGASDVRQGGTGADDRVLVASGSGGSGDLALTSGGSTGGAGGSTGGTGVAGASDGPAGGGTGGASGGQGGAGASSSVPGRPECSGTVTGGAAGSADGVGGVGADRSPPHVATVRPAVVVAADTSAGWRRRRQLLGV